MTYGQRDASFLAAGGSAGLAALVDAFYDYMDTLPEAAGIRAMHGADLAMSRDKLRTFLSAWLGGPNEYTQRFGPISIPRVHAALGIAHAERDAWLACMARAVADQPWERPFKSYFLAAIAIPAERIRVVCEARAS